MSADAWDEDPGVDPTPADIHRGFTVEDIASAEWALRKLCRARDRHAENARYVDAELDRLRAWLAQSQAELDDAEGFFGGRLEAWHRQLLEDDGRRKTVVLPSGALKARQSPARVEVADGEAFVCCHGFDSPLVRVTAKPDLVAVKRAVLTDGEALPGVEVVVGEVRFTVVTAPSIAPPVAVPDVF